MHTTNRMLRTVFRHLGVAATSTVLLAPKSVSAQTVAITGGKVYPVSGPVIENGTVLVRDGKIVAVGANVAVPNDATRIDATGKWVTPGLINALTGLGVSEIGWAWRYGPGRTPGEAAGPRRRIAAARG